MKRRTVISRCGAYRYVLWRELDATQSNFVLFIGLNPSTADATTDDPTIRRCKDFARRWGFGALCMANLFAFRATRPEDLKSTPVPVGPRNNHWLRRLAEQADLIVAAWGVDGAFAGRDRKVMQLVRGPVHCLGTTKDGHPRHPLYLKQSATPVVWGPPG